MVTGTTNVTNGAVALLSAPMGVPLRIVSVECGRGLASRLASIGLRTGLEITLLRARPRGPVIVALGNARFALGRGVADRLFVVPLAARGTG